MNNFMNLPKEYRTEESKFLIFNIPWEKDVSYGKGARNGAEEIIKASKQLEYFDIDYKKEIFQKGIRTIKIEPKKFEDISKQIEIKNKFPVFIGGDHSITIQTTKTIKDDFDIITFDAHPDYFYSWNGSTNNHRCTNRRLINNHNILIAGLRSCDIEEYKQIKDNKKIEYITSKEYNIKKLRQKIKFLKKNIYISIDVDVFDPAFIRNTGTPEPNGLTWKNIIESLELIFKEKNVLALDVVEFAPKYNYRAEAYSFAKLTHKCLILKRLINI